MIAIDSSALVAVALKEEGYRAYLAQLLAHPCVVGWPTLVETHLALRGRSPAKGRAVESFLRYETLRPAPFDEAMFRTACDAFDRFGKGRGHRAQLNFGDCLAYAVAKTQNLPLLFKGDDFRRTDIRPVL